MTVTETTKRKHGEQQIYRMQTDQGLTGVIVTLGGVLAVTIVLSLLVGDVTGNVVFAIIMLMFFVMSYLASLITSKNRLVISSAGIRWHYYGLSGQTTWDNIDHIGDRFHGHLNPMTLVFKTPVIPAEPDWLAQIYSIWASDWYAALQAQLPLEEFAAIDRPYLQTSDRLTRLLGLHLTPLGRDIDYYAPHLFDTASAEMKLKPDVDRTGSF